MASGGWFWAWFLGGGRYEGLGERMSLDAMSAAGDGFLISLLERSPLMGIETVEGILLALDDHAGLSTQ